jgi:hypothetical protein
MKFRQGVVTLALTWKFFLAALMVLSAGSWLPGQIVNEKIEVVNVEVPVRVFCDGKPLDSLQKSDFQLYENNELQEINGFYLRRKKMNVQHVTMQADQNAVSLPPRYFVLVFRIFQYNEQLRKGIDYLFTNILRDQDQLLIMVNDRTLILNQDIWQIRRQEILDRILHEEAVKAGQELELYFQRVNQEIENSFQLNFIAVANYLERYLEIQREFKIKYLVPDLDKFYNFARYLEKIKAEKWVLNFYQMEMFPKMKIGAPMRRQIDSMVTDFENLGSAAAAYARKITRSLNEIDSELGMENKFPAEQIGKMLIQVDTTYHCFISSVERKGMDENFEYKNVASDLENSLREITRRSGGEVTFSENIGSALHAIEDKEDVYYVLTYVPKKPESHGKIMIKVNDARFSLLYDDNLRSDYIAQYLQNKSLVDPTIKAHDLAFAQGKLHFAISDFRMTEKNKKLTGQLKVVIRICDSDNNLVYDQNRLIEAREKSVSIDIGFDWLKPGRHVFFMEIHDLLSGRMAMDVLPVEN